MKSISSFVRDLHAHMVQNTPCSPVPVLEVVARSFIYAINLIEEFGDCRLPVDASFGRPSKASTWHNHDMSLGYASVRRHLLVDGSNDVRPKILGSRSIGFHALGEFLITAYLATMLFAEQYTRISVPTTNVNGCRCMFPVTSAARTRSLEMSARSNGPG